jgi:NitT/TauT family transport system ATP-binding protein
MSLQANTTPRIRVEGLWKAFRGAAGTVMAIEDVSLSIADGEFFSIVGPSGCGKSTLLRIMAGLEKESVGQVTFAPPSGSRPLRSVVFQEQSIFPWMSVRDNIAYGLAMRGVSRAQRREVVDYYLDRVGLRAFAKAYPHELSGGMKQRVSLARAFANDPEVLLMDEPFAALDEQNKSLLHEGLLRIWSETRKTVVFITHSIDEALLLSDRVMIMTARPGKVKALISVPFERPRSLYDLRATSEFGRISAQVWSLLRDEVSAASAAELSA